MHGRQRTTDEQVAIMFDISKTAPFSAGNSIVLGGGIPQDQMPPKGPSVEVVVLEDFGEVAFSIGRANLAKGSSHLLPRDEAEPLIRSGVLQLMDV